MSDLTEKEKQSGKKSLKKLWPWLIFMMVTIVLQGYFDRQPDSIWKTLTTLAIAVPMLAIVTIQVRYILQMDEYMRKMYMVSAVYTLILTTGAAYLYGLLEKAVGFPPLNLSAAAASVFLIWFFMGIILVSRG
ncbi:MAG: hypothetical protein GXP02_03460 [Alphaproteobacteria bacterium]|nr:hypothetical protein [Alphaproteobacteria bacterium]